MSPGPNQDDSPRLADDKPYGYEEAERGSALPLIDRRSLRHSGRWWWALFGLAALSAALVLLHASRGLGFFYDEWTWIIQRRHFSVGTILNNHNGHLNAVPVLVFLAMFHLFGLASYWPYLIMVVLVHLMTCAILFVWLRRRTTNPLALGATIVLLFLGFAWQDLLWPFQIQFVGAIAAGLGALILVDRQDQRSDIAASFCLLIAVSCSGTGLTFVLGVFVWLCWGRSTWPRLWVPLVPLAIYVLWSLSYGATQAKSSNLRLVPGYFWGSASASASALIGTTISYGGYLVCVLACLALLRLLFSEGSGRTAAIVAMPLAFWFLIAIARADTTPPTTSRYLYGGVVFLILAIGEVGRTRRSGIAMLVVVLAIVSLSIHGNIRELSKGSGFLRDSWGHLGVELGAVELLGKRIDSHSIVDPVYFPGGTVAEFLRAFSELGSPAPSAREMRRMPERYRAGADAVILRASTANLPPPRAPKPTNGTLSITSGTRSVSGRPCVTLQPPISSGVHAVINERELDVSMISNPPALILIRARSLGSQFEGSGITVAPGRAVVVRLPGWSLGPWALEVSSSSPILVCHVAGSQPAR